MKSAPIRAVFFDVGGTLIYPWPSVGAVYARIGRDFGFRSTPEAMDQAFRAAWQDRKKAVGPGKLTTSNKEWWRSLVFQALAIQGLTGSDQVKATYFEALYAAFVAPEAWRIFPDVVPTLEALRCRKVHLGIISNWDQRLRPLINGLDLVKYFDSITVSCEVGVEKPDPAIFSTALKAAGIPAEQALHVGDSEHEDGQGAMAAGLRFLQVRQAEEAGLGLVEAMVAAACA